MKTIVIDGVIGDSWDGLSTEQFQKLMPRTGEDIRLLINSPGGSVNVGFEIYNYIKMYSGKVEIIIGSMAASIAGYIAMAVPKEQRKAFKNSSFMMHESWTVAAGRARDMRIVADWLDGINDIISETIADGIGKEKKKVRKMISEDYYIPGWENLLEENIISDIIEYESMKEDEFVYPEKSEFSWSIFGQALETDFEARKKEVNDLDIIMEKDSDKMWREIDKVAALDLSTLKKQQPKEQTQTQTQENSPAPKADENITQESNSMNLDEFRNSSPEAEAEFQAALESAKAQERKDANKNTVEILRLEGVTISETAAKALDSAMDVENYALEKLQAEAEKRKNSETQETSEAVFGKITAKQTPQEQAAKTEVDMAEYEKGIKEAAIKYAKGGR